MFLLKKILTSLILPPAGLILLALLGLWISRWQRKAGLSLSLLSLIVLLLLSLPATSGRLMDSLERYSPIGPDQLSKAQAIVILGGGIYRNSPEYGGDTIGRSSLERTRYGLFLHRNTKLPILVSGGAPHGGLPEADAIRRTIEEEFRSSVRWTENRSRDTAENARYSAAILKKEGITRIALVSHGWHLPRAVELFEREGLVVYAAPTIFAQPTELSLTHFLPNAGALNTSSRILQEWLGRLSQYASPALGLSLTPPDAADQAYFQAKT